MKTNKKKILVLVSMVILLVAVGFLNYFLTASSLPGTNPPTTTPTFFSSFRSEREVTRNQELTYLDAIITATTSTEEIIKTAQMKKLAICDAMEKELVLEGLIKAKGFEDCIVTMSTENVNVVVKDNDVTVAERAQIVSIITKETKHTIASVIVTPYSLK